MARAKPKVKYAERTGEGRQVATYSVTLRKVHRMWWVRSARKAGVSHGAFAQELFEQAMMADEREKEKEKEEEVEG
jgi:hypothetical protein